jgi:hypothetical protein
MNNQDGTPTKNVSLPMSAIGLQGGVGLCILNGVSSSGWLADDGCGSKRLVGRLCWCCCRLHGIHSFTCVSFFSFRF